VLFIKRRDLVANDAERRGERNDRRDQQCNCRRKQLLFYTHFISLSTPYSPPIAKSYNKNNSALTFRAFKANGTPIPQNDIWIAACAIDAGATLISSDSHFAKIPLLDISII
jgi:predicted nucleic acid-binding protein